MFGLGTIINTVAIIIGGLLGLQFGRFIKEEIQKSLGIANGVTVLMIGIAGTMSGMLAISDGGLTSVKSMFAVLSIVIGAVIGEILNIEGLFERFGTWLKMKTGNAKDKNFVEGFVTASLTVSIGAMAIIGAIQDGIYGDYSLLATKAVLDLVIIMVMTCSMGKGCIFSAIPVFALQGSVTIFASWVKVFMTDAALANLSLVGSILIFCVGLNLVWGKMVRVANLLPAIIVAVAMSFLPINL